MSKYLQYFNGKLLQITTNLTLTSSMQGPDGTASGSDPVVTVGVLRDEDEVNYYLSKTITSDIDQHVTKSSVIHSHVLIEPTAREFLLNELDGTDFNPVDNN